MRCGMRINVDSYVTVAVAIVWRLPCLRLTNPYECVRKRKEYYKMVLLHEVIQSSSLVANFDVVQSYYAPKSMLASFLLR